jgi:LEA14-like dessication related protein
MDEKLHIPRKSGPSRKALLPIVVMLACVLAVGCSTLHQLHLDRLEVTLQSVEITDVDEEGLSVVFWIDVYNPTSTEIQGTKVETVLILEGNDLGRWGKEQTFVLAPASHTRVDFPAKFAWESLARSVREIIQLGSLSYELTADLWLKTSFGVHTYSFANSGQAEITTPGESE